MKNIDVIDILVCLCRSTRDLIERAKLKRPEGFEAGNCFWHVRF